MSSQRCLICRRQLSFRERSRGVMAMSLVGLPRFHAGKLMPRCPECLSRHVDEYQLTPGACIRALRVPVAAIQVNADDWDAVHREIVNARAEFCAARMGQGDILAVVTTALFPDWKTTEAGLAASWLERHIQQRPPGAVPRFVASAAWDPFSLAEFPREEHPQADAGSAVERLSVAPVVDRGEGRVDSPGQP